MSDKLANHALARAYFTALSSGDLPESLLTHEMNQFTIRSLTAEDDRVVAEAESYGKLVNGTMRIVMFSCFAFAMGDSQRLPSTTAR